MHETVIKKCEKHGETEFAAYKYENGTRHRCKKCRTEGVQRRREKVKLLAIEYMGGKCCKCGYNKCPWALDFHHIDPATKSFTISADGFTRSFNKIKDELNKCILLCANCHREEHYTSTIKDNTVKMHTRQCLQCNKDFICNASNNCKKYCSRTCAVYVSRQKRKIRRNEKKST
jgi:hypothetical protein